MFDLAYTSRKAKVHSHGRTRNLQLQSANLVPTLEVTNVYANNWILLQRPRKYLAILSILKKHLEHL